jgi:CRISPR/Cas system-associated exonuclease Cas4 (RecB family)
METDEYISASEIGNYLFCQRAWWYRLHGAVNSQQQVMDAGTAAHEQLAQEVKSIAYASRFARQLIIAGIVLLALVILFRLLRG